MRVVVPYTYGAAQRTTGVFTALRATGYVYDMVNVGGSDRHYYDLLSALWRDGDTFCIVEHDIVVHPTALRELDECPHDWCGFPHLYGGKPTYGLGCVKFGADLIARHPDAMIRVGTLFDANHPKRHWCRMDAWLQATILPGMGEARHEHETLVRHLGVGCAHGCTTTF